MRGKYPALVSVWMVDGSLWKYMRAGKLDRRGAMSMVWLIGFEHLYALLEFNLCLDPRGRKRAVVYAQEGRHSR